MRLDRYAAIAVLTTALVFAQALGTSEARAQCTPGETCVTVGADAKGALGGGILGAEIGFMIPALIVYAGARELDEWWSWVLFPALGAVGGALAGYYGLEDPTTMTDSGMIQRGFPEAAVAVLAVSMALIVPTFVGVLALTSYNPGEDTGGQGASGDEDAPPDDAGDEAPSNEATRDEATQSALRRTLAGGPGLIRFDRGQLLLGVPMVHSADTFTREERAHMQLGQSADIRVPVVSGVF